MAYVSTACYNSNYCQKYYIDGSSPTRSKKVALITLKKNLRKLQSNGTHKLLWL